jgi:hypothetical protein
MRCSRLHEISRFSAGGGFGGSCAKNIADAKTAHPCGDDNGKNEPGDSVTICSRLDHVSSSRDFSYGESKVLLQLATLVEKEPKTRTFEVSVSGPGEAIIMQ